MRYLIALLAALALLAAACGDDDNGGDDSGPSASAQTLTVDVSMGDSFFDPDAFTVPARAIVTVNTVNDGLLLHNLRIAGPDGEYNTDDDAANADYVTAGSSGTFEWVAPGEPGGYKFRCDIHPDVMVGSVTVE